MGHLDRLIRYRHGTAFFGFAIVKVALPVFFASQSTKEKLNVYHAIIMYKLLYGLESAALDETVKHSLDMFQLRSLRKILNIKTTFVDRTQDNKTVHKTAQEAVEAATRSGKQIRQIKPNSEMYEERTIKWLNKIVLSQDQSPLTQMTFNAR